MQYRFTLAQIQAFARIVETGSFQAAARQLSLAQPTVSQRVQQLEEAIGASLFTRLGPRISLTPEGQSLFEQSSSLLNSASKIAEHFRTRGPLTGNLRLGVIDSFALMCLEDLLRRLDDAYPGLMPSVRVIDSASLSRMLQEHELDIAILVDPKGGGGIRHEAVGHLRNAWFASTSLRLPPIKHPGDLASQHIILPAPPSLLYANVMEWFSDAGVTPTRVSTCNSYTVAVRTILSGLAIGVIPPRIVEKEIARRLVRRLTMTPALSSNKVSVSYQTATLGPELKDIVELVRKLIAEHRLYS